MTYRMIHKSRERWLSRQDCPARQLLEYMTGRGKMRDAQIDAIKTYLFLKMEHGARPLAELYAEGAFNSIDADDLEISAHAREAMQEDPGLLSLYEYLSDEEVSARNAMEVIKAHPEKIDTTEVFEKIFYETSYTDYIFSLPMGAGKTYLMAAIIYIDLYYSTMDPLNGAFAKNFVVFAPSGLKSSVVPSLKTIQSFDPSWVIPEPAASELRAALSFEVLDEQKSSSKSNRAKNPNVQKVAIHQPFETLSGLVLVTNAEKVILNKVSTDDDGEMRLLSEEQMDDATRAENELRRVIGELPDLAVIIDEVHHAQNDDIKLRAVVNQWAAEGDTINCVLGFSGTPFLKSKAKVDVTEEVGFKSGFMANVVHYYPLSKGIGNFLKRPTVEIVDGTREEIVEEGVTSFLDEYGDFRYANGTVPKMAIFCGNVTKLEEEVYPLVARIVSERGMDPNRVILKYHRGGTGAKKYPTSGEWAVEFAMLDSALSEKRIVLLAQIGKEGWDCRSLAGVILSQEGDCSKNMVLQTSCRCLREVVKGEPESALIVLNDKNADHLKKQLEQTQHIDLETFSKGVRDDAVVRHSRVERLRLPKIEHMRFRLSRELKTEDLPLVEVDDLIMEIPGEAERAVEVQRVEDLDFDPRSTEYGLAVMRESTMPITYRRWKHDLLFEAGGVPESLSAFSSSEQGDAMLRHLFEKTTRLEDGQRFISSSYDQPTVRSKLRALFYPRRTVAIDMEEIEEVAYASFVDERKLTPVYDVPRDRFYPDERRVGEVLEADEHGDSNDIKKAYETLVAAGQVEVAESLLRDSARGKADNTYQYLPYRFDSPYEREFYETIMGLSEINDMGLEVYFNGDNALADFRVECFKRRGSTWKRVGLYTPDFLVVKREGDALRKLLIVETKGAGYENDQGFSDRRGFMEEIFVPKNNEFFGEERFDYRVLTDDVAGRNLRDTLRSVLADCFRDEPKPVG